MTQSINPLDRLFRRKLDKRPFDMDPGHWESMSAMLDAAEKKKKRGAYWILGFSLLIIAVTSVVFWPAIPASSDKLSEQLSESNEISNYTINSEQPNNPADQSLTTNDLQEESVTTESIDLQHLNSVQITKAKDIGQTKPANIITDNSTNTLKPQVNGTSRINSDNAYKSELENQNNVEVSSVKPRFIADDLTILTSDDQDAKSEESTDLKSSNSLLDPNKSINSRLEAKTINYSVVRLLPPWSNIELISVNDHPVLNSYFNDSGIDDEFVPRFKMGFYLEGMLGLAKGNSGLAGFRLGLIGQYLISSSSSIQFEPGYHQRVGLDAYSKLRQDNVYDFGLNKEIFGMFAKTAHFVSFPISYKYQLRKHGFEAGADLNYLLGVQGDVQEVTLMNIEDPIDLTRSAKVNEVVESLSTGWLDMAPFATLTNRYFLGYNYEVNRGFILGIRGYYQPKALLESPPNELLKPDHTKLLIGLQAKFIIE